MDLNNVMDYTIKLNYLLLSALLTIAGCNESDSNNEIDNNIDVYISTGELQCQGNGLSIAETKSYLADADIEVTSESCGFLTQAAYPAVCGGGTGTLHVFTIDNRYSLVAENIGFTIPDSAIFEEDYEKVECSA
jgi:hypothetical protein